jgi:hypothetical protein
MAAVEEASQTPAAVRAGVAADRGVGVGGGRGSARWSSGGLRVGQRDQTDSLSRAASMRRGVALSRLLDGDPTVRGGLLQTPSDHNTLGYSLHPDYRI